MADALFLAATLARLVAGSHSVAVGTNSPIPAAATLLAREQAKAKDKRLTISILGSPRHTPFTDGGRELFDFAAQGRLDSFFLGGGQIDGGGNINLVGTGDYPTSNVRWPGSFGSAYLYHLIPRVILFREEHSPRVFVPKVDFISAKAITPEIARRGGPHALLTNMALFDFDRARGGFTLRSVHPPFTPADIRENTGFDYLEPDTVAETPRPDAATLALLRGRILDELAETYPAFARTMRQAA